MNLDQATEHVKSNLLDFLLRKAFNDDERDVDLDFIEPFVVFMSQQSGPIPFGAVIGNLVGSRTYLINAAILFLEALGEADIIIVKNINGNWLVNPVNVEHEIHPALGCDSKPISVDPRKAFCGTTLHNPKPTRVDHLQSMNDISLTVNHEFVENFPDIPKNVPFIKTLPAILKSADKLHLNHRFDTRGRTYCSSHLNYQGTQYEKCLVKFTKELMVTGQGRQNIQSYMESLKDDDMYLRFNALNALDAAATGIPISADASASGTQLMSVLKGCEKSAESVGLTALNDFYTLCDSKCDLEFPEGTDTRKVFKECSMQHFYGGTKTPKAKLGEDNLPKFYETLTELAPGCQILLQELQSIYHASPVFTWTLPDGFEVQQAVVQTRRVELNLPHNPNVTFGYAYKSLVKRDTGLEMAANVVHSVDGYVARELVYRAKQGNEVNAELIEKLERAYKRCAPDSKTGTQCFSFYRLLETPSNRWAFLGKTFLGKALQYCNNYTHLPSFDVITIHDDFKCHPNYLHHVKTLYVEILADIADSTLIKDIVEEINPEVTYNHNPNPTLAMLMRSAYYQGTGNGLT